MLGLTLFAGMYVPATVQAAQPAGCSKSFFGIPTWYEYLPLNPDCSVNTKNENGTLVILIVLAAIDILLFLAGFIAVFFIIYGGFKYMTSLAEPSRVAAAKTTVLNAVIGLVIAIFASVIISFIAGKLS